MKQKIKRPTGVKLIEEVKFPEPGVWDDLVRDLKLNVSQSNELKITVQHVVEDIAYYRLVRSKEPARDILTTRVKLMEKALSNLQYQVDCSIDLMTHFLPDDTMARIGRSFTFSAIGEALGKDVFPQNFDFFIGRMLADGKQVTMAALEELSRPKRGGLGLTHGHRILKHFIDAINAPLKKWLEIDKLNKGGRSPQVARTVLIHRLAEAAPGIIGKRAPVAATGSFVTLCSLVLPACGLSAKGVEKAIPPIVKPVRAEQERQSRRGLINAQP
jgi:hypothetical protein